MSLQTKTTDLTKRIELVIGVDIDALLQELKVVGEERARYRAMFYSSFSGSSISDEQRKILKAECVSKILKDKRDERIAANLVETLAYAEPIYKGFIQKQHEQKIEFETLDARYKYLEYMLEVTKQKMFFLKAETDNTKT